MRYDFLAHVNPSFLQTEFALKSARAPRRLGNVKNRRTMFYLDRRGEPVATAATKYDLPPSNGEENFGWWLSRSKIAALPRSRRDWDHRSPGSSASMFFYVDSDDSDDWTFAQEASDGQQNKTREKIELRTFVQDDLNIERIKRNAGKTVRAQICAKLSLSLSLFRENPKLISGKIPRQVALLDSSDNSR